MKRSTKMIARYAVECLGLGMGGAGIWFTTCVFANKSKTIKGKIAWTAIGVVGTVVEKIAANHYIDLAIDEIGDQWALEDYEDFCKK